MDPTRFIEKYSEALKNVLSADRPKLISMHKTLYIKPGRSPSTKVLRDRLLKRIDDEKDKFIKKLRTQPQPQIPKISEEEYQLAGQFLEEAFRPAKATPKPLPRPPVDLPKPLPRPPYDLPKPLPRPTDKEVIPRETAINDNFVEVTISDGGHGNPITWIVEHIDMYEIINNQLQTWTGLKLAIKIDAIVENAVNNRYDEHIFRTKFITILRTNSLEDDIIEETLKLSEQIDEFTGKGSGWRLVGWSKITLILNNYKPIKGSSYLPLPKHFANKKAIINIKNNDDKCFAYSVLAHICPAAHDPQRVSKYVPYLRTLIDEKIKYPMPVCERAYRKFEERFQIRVNVFSYEGDEIYPVYISKTSLLFDSQTVDIFLIHKDTEDGTKKYHYA